MVIGLGLSKRHREIGTWAIALLDPLRLAGHARLVDDPFRPELERDVKDNPAAGNLMDELCRLGGQALCVFRDQCRVASPAAPLRSAMSARTVESMVSRSSKLRLS